MEIDRVCSHETQTPSTAVLLQWCYDLCNWMIKVVNLFGTFVSSGSSALCLTPHALLVCGAQALHHHSVYF